MPAKKPTSTKKSPPPRKKAAGADEPEELAEAKKVTTSTGGGKPGNGDDKPGPPSKGTVKVEGPVEVTTAPGKPVEVTAAPGKPMEVTTVPDEPVEVEVTNPVSTISLRRSRTQETADQPLWVAIRNRTHGIGFKNYQSFIDRVLCEGDYSLDSDAEKERLKSELKRKARRLELRRSLHGVDAYELLKAATEVFLILQCGVYIDEEGYDPKGEGGRFGLDGELSLQAIAHRLTGYLGEGRLPYISRVLTAIAPQELEEAATPGSRGGDHDDRPIPLPFCADSVIAGRIDDPCLLELIWSYWHEEGMLVQSLASISLRFQNKRAAGGSDPLAQLELDPLRPLSNLLWGYIQDEFNRLTVPRRAYEYEHHYGLSLLGKAVPKLRPADRRSKFLEAFHTLLHRAWVFYQEDADTTVIAEGFPLLNALKEVHMILAEGAHNQFGDLPWTARVEMLIQQWLLARPEVRDFLRGRYMVPFREDWMGPADTLKKLKRWGDTSVSHFRDLGVYGEQILLSVRYGDWVDVNDQDHAKNWARYFKPEIQSYLHAYRAATGIDLTHPDGLDFTPPAVHLRDRLARQQAKAR